MDSINSCHGILRHPLVLLKAIFDFLATRILNFNHNKKTQSSNTGSTVSPLSLHTKLHPSTRPTLSLNLMRRAQLLQHGGTHGVLVREVSVMPPLTSEPMATIHASVHGRSMVWPQPITAGWQTHGFSSSARSATNVQNTIERWKSGEMDTRKPCVSQPQGPLFPIAMISKPRSLLLDFFPGCFGSFEKTR